MRFQVLLRPVLPLGAGGVWGEGCWGAPGPWGGGNEWFSLQPEGFKSTWSDRKHRKNGSKNVSCCQTDGWRTRNSVRQM